MKGCGSRVAVVRNLGAKVQKMLNPVATRQCASESCAANLAGTEAAAAVERMLDGWSDEYQAVAPSGRFKPNALGLYDMTGNVSEWTHDVYASFVDPAPATDPIGPSQSGARRVIKGSSWRTASFSELRAAWREGAEGPSQDIGIRVARHAD